MSEIAIMKSPTASNKQTIDLTHYINKKFQFHTSLYVTNLSMHRYQKIQQALGRHQYPTLRREHSQICQYRYCLLALFTIRRGSQ